MDSERLKLLIDLVANSRIAELEIVEGKEKIRIVKAANSSPGVSVNSKPVAGLADGTDPVPDTTESSAIDAAGGHVVTATMYGILHLSPSPGESSFVSVGDVVAEGQSLCLIEAMKVFNTVSADRAGKISAVLVTTGAEVQTGQPLFRIE